ncbi:MAG TPA: hypothetical protein VMS93_14045 [Candidatus Saccharimonadales bacterium]|nr:hypothetical protein [Candidatus Saccharimonadales bacterium]
MRPCYRVPLLALALAALLPVAAAATVGVPIPIKNLHCNDANGVTTMLNQTVTVRGIVTGQFPTTGAASSTRLYIEDSGGGVNIFGSPLYCGGLGDDITVTGVVQQYNGLVEVGSVVGPPAVNLVITVNSIGNPQPPARHMSISEIKAIVSAGQCEPYESWLVSISACVIKSSAGGAPPATFDCTAGQNLRLCDAGDLSNYITLRINKDMPNTCPLVDPLNGVAIPTGTLCVLGVLSQFIGTSPYNGGWQLMPRRPADIVPVSECVTPVKPTTWGQIRRLYR